MVAVGLGELAVSARPRETLVAWSLGSCLGLTMYDPLARIGGLVHCLLPDSGLCPTRAHERPAMFVDSGLAELLCRLRAAGAEPRRLQVKAAGGAALLGEGGLFRIGERNLEALHAVLPRLGLRLHGSLLGGTEARTLLLAIDTGRAAVRHRGQEREL